MQTKNNKKWCFMNGGKKSYPTPEKAIEHAQKFSDRYGTHFFVYKCPVKSREEHYHLTSHAQKHGG